MSYKDDGIIIIIIKKMNNCLTVEFFVKDFNTPDFSKRKSENQNKQMIYILRVFESEVKVKTNRI